MKSKISSGAPRAPNRLGFVLAYFALAVGCAGAGTLTRKDVMLHYDRVAALDRGVADARGRDAALLAPTHFKRAQELLDEAIEHAREAHKDRANAVADAGLTALAQVDANISLVNREMQEVLATRQRAIHEGAPALLKQEFSDADRQLRSATASLEANAVDEARQKRPALMEKYAALELEAIKRGVMEGAQLSIQEAEQKEADEYAPRTLSEAEEELHLARAVLESDRTRRPEAEAHARRAIWLAGRAEAITTLAKQFEKDDYKTEDLLLWHQEQLRVVNEPLDTQLPFDKSDRAAVTALQSSIKSLLTALDDARHTARANEQELASLQQALNAAQLAHEAKLAELAEAGGQQLAQLKTRYEAQLSAEGRKQREDKLRQEQAEQRFRRVENLFKPDEASVSRTANSVRIDVYGFDFAPGESMIGSANFGLMDRLISAVRTFPGSRVRVSGHTDAVGSDARNLELSIQRARAVAQFLTDIGGIEAGRVESDGYGESRPVATNETKEGRSRNRRVEILISNVNGTDSPAAAAPTESEAPAGPADDTPSAAPRAPTEEPEPSVMQPQS